MSWGNYDLIFLGSPIFPRIQLFHEFEERSCVNKWPNWPVAVYGELTENLELSYFSHLPAAGG